MPPRHFRPSRLRQIIELHHVDGEDWARSGSAIFLDPKGELFKYTARYFKRIYRLDLADPRHSDRWNFVPACKGDGELAHEVASIVVGFDANKNVGFDPFWPQAETALMTALLLHLPQIAENPIAAMIAEFIAARGFDQINHEMRSRPTPRPASNGESSKRRIEKRHRAEFISAWAQNSRRCARPTRWQ